MNLEAEPWRQAVHCAVRMGANIRSGVACETLAGQGRKGSVGALLKIIVIIIHHYMLHEPTAVAFQAAQQLPLSWQLLAFGMGKNGRVFSFFFKCLMIILSLERPWHSAVSHCVDKRRNMSWWDTLWLGTEGPGYPSLNPSAPSTPLGSAGASLAMAAAHEGSPGPFRFLSLHKNSPNSEMQPALPALQGGVGREGEHEPSRALLASLRPLFS